MKLLTKKLLFFATCSVFVVIFATKAIRANADTLVQIAYAHVLSDGTLDTANSLNVVSMKGVNGLYCFKLRFKPKNAVATLANDPTASNQGVGFVKVAVPPTPSFTCPGLAKPDAFVETGSETGVNSGQSAGGYSFYVQWTK